MPLVNVHWLAIIGGLMATTLLFLVPEIVRARAGRSTPAAAILRAADALAFPAKLIGLLHNGDVRLHTLCAVVGAALLCAGFGGMPWPDTPPVVEAASARPSAVAADHVEITATWPQLVLVAAAVLGLLAKVALRDRAFIPVLVLTFASLAASAGLLVHLYDPPASRWHDMMGLMRLDPLAVVGQTAILAVAAVMVAASLFALGDMAGRRTDLLVTVVLAVAGATIAVAATDMLTLYTGLALMAVCNVILLGMASGDPAATEAAVKYFLATMTAFGLLLFGTALLYAAIGDTQYGGIADGLARLIAVQQGPTRLAAVGLALVIAGVAMLIGLVPFHMHVPDAYQGAPAAIVGFAVSVPATAALFVLVRLLMGPLAAVGHVAQPFLLLLGIGSLVVGALAAVVQTDPRRMLGHLGVALAGVVICLIVGIGANLAAGQDTPYAHEAFAITLLLAIALPAGGGVAAAALHGIRLDMPIPDAHAVWQRTVAAGPVFIGAMVCLSLAAAMLHAAGPGRFIEMPPIPRWTAVAALVLAASRLTILFWRLSAKPSAPVPASAKARSASILLVLVIVAVAGALCTGHVINAVTAMWP
jgi:NADH-quinone oxidoreductase subunit N